jgi:BirA family transcriptional regulator, biotin operon repressor / biotin---[acetyl-CoA-carboxylase] ligase
MSALGRPRLHLRTVGSTNARARELAQGGAGHGSLVTATEQTAGRGRQGRSWAGPPGRALLMSLILREHDELLSLRAGLAVADVAGEAARVKWPNDVLIDDRKVAGILVEGRPQESWAVLGVGVNVAVELTDLPEDLRATAGTLGRDAADLEAFLHDLLAALGARLQEPPGATIAALRGRDALRGRQIRWSGGAGVAQGIDDRGRLIAGEERLDAGEVHLL